ncbi:MAG: hypothetical protein ACOYOE_00650 [Chlorobium sp.]
MAKDKKKGGFFSAFRDHEVSGKSEAVSQSHTPPTVSVPTRPAPPADPPKAAVVQKPVAVQAQPEPVIDTVESFKVLCQSLADIGASQLKVAEMIVNMLSNSLNKIVEGSKPGKQG